MLMQSNAEFAEFASFEGRYFDGESEEMANDARAKFTRVVEKVAGRGCWSFITENPSFFVSRNASRSWL